MTESTTWQPAALRVRPIAVAWLLTVGVDLFFNAGLFAGLFDQNREPALLSDTELFQRIPVAYLSLAVGVTALAWLFDRLDLRGAWQGARMGAIAGLVVACLGIVALWTALAVTGLLVVGGLFVQVVEFAAAGAYLGSFRNNPEPRRITRIAIAAALVAAIAGIVIQNILDS